jgi:hypothetical protein
MSSLRVSDQVAIYVDWMFVLHKVGVNKLHIISVIYSAFHRTTKQNYVGNYYKPTTRLCFGLRKTLGARC